MPRFKEVAYLKARNFFTIIVYILSYWLNDSVRNEPGIIIITIVNFMLDSEVFFMAMIDMNVIRVVSILKKPKSKYGIRRKHLQATF